MRRIPKNGIGILENCWQVFRKLSSLKPEKVKMITLPATTFHIWLCKDSTYGRASIFPNLYDNEVPQTGKITNGLWRSDPTTET